MKIIRIVLIGLLLMGLAGCGGGGEEPVVCDDCQPHIDVKTSLIEENNRLKTDIINLQTEVISLKNKTTIGNTYNTSTVYLGDCTTCTRLLNKKEILLEECYADDNDDNYKDLYKDCKDDRNDLEDDIEELENEINTLEDDVDDCINDLTDCEEE